jgi:virginiamycin B lyase
MDLVPFGARTREGLDVRQGQDRGISHRDVAVFLATLLVLTLALAPRAEAFVYWGVGTTGGHGLEPTSIQRANLNGAGTRTLVHPIFDDTRGVAVDASHIYWSGTTFNVGRASLDGAGIDDRFIAGAGPGAGVAVNDSHIFWADEELNAIGRANLDGTGVNPSFIAPADPCGVAVSDSHIFWANEGTNSIGRANLNGTGVNPSFITGADDPCWIAVNASHIYWANRTPLSVPTTDERNTIGRANLNGTGVNQSLVRLAGFPCGVAVNSSHVYWAYSTFDRGGPRGAIARALLDGSDAEDVVDVFGACGVTLDGLRSNEFTVEKVNKNKKRGTAKVTVLVPGAGALELAKTKKVKGAKVAPDAGGEVKLPVRPRGQAKKKLKKKGKAKVKAKLTFSSPEGGAPVTESEKIKLVKR